MARRRLFSLRWQLAYSPERSGKHPEIAITVWSLTILDDQYNDGIPAGSRFDVHSEEFQRRLKELQTPE